MLEIKLPGRTAAPGASVGVEESSQNEDPLTLKVEVSGHALKVLKFAFGEKVKIGLELEFLNTYNNAANQVTGVSSTATSSTF